jgi:hypothetical protein
MNDNTILRIKVPAHLYESVKEQLTITEAKKGAHNLGAGMELVKEKKMKVPKDGMKKVEETNENMEKKVRTLDELKAAKSKLEKKIEEMKNGDGKMKEKKDKPYYEIAADAIDAALSQGDTDQSKLDILLHLKDSATKKMKEMNPSKGKMEENQVNEYDPKFQGAMDVLGSIPGIDKIAQIDPFTAGVALVGMVVGGLVAAPKIEKGVKALMAKIKDPKKKAQLAAAAEKGGVNVGGEVM